MNILSTIIFLPIIAALFIILLGRTKVRSGYNLALLVSFVVFALSLYIGIGFDPGLNQFQFIEQVNWISSFNIQYHLGIDGISYPLILLTTLLTPLVILTSKTSPKDKYHQYLASFLILEGLMIGVFTSLDGLLFYIFWESMLIPMFIIIGIWGGNNRVYATVKFFLYTFLGSIFLLIAIIYLYFQTGGYAITDFHTIPLTMNEQVFIFLAFFLAFAVKIPMWPVHTWLPDAHVEAPTGGSVILAAVLLKMGAYGFLRFSLPITPDASAYFSPFILVLSLIAIVYIGLVAIAQMDMKKLIAYSSIAHMGYAAITLIAAINSGNLSPLLAAEAAGIYLLTYATVTLLAFTVISHLAAQDLTYETGQLQHYQGLLWRQPIAAVGLLIAMLALAGMPLTAGFIGKYYVFIAAVDQQLWPLLWLLIIGSAMGLYYYLRVILILCKDSLQAETKSYLGLAPLITLLALLTLWLGIYPSPSIAWVQQALTGF